MKNSEGRALVASARKHATGNVGFRRTEARSSLLSMYLPFDNPRERGCP